MTITFGLWVIPATITVVGGIAAGSYRSRGDYDFGGAILAALWFVASLTSWVMWGLTWMI